MEDVAEKVTVGPFYTVPEVSAFVGSEVWVPTQRFEVVQKNKVRGVDSATTNGVNMATEIQEKLDLLGRAEGISADPDSADAQEVERDLAQRSRGRKSGFLCDDRPLLRPGVRRL